MSVKLPVCSGTQAIRAFERAGWNASRQKGDHVSMIKAGSFRVLTVPLHKELAKGTLRRLIHDAGLTVEQFLSSFSKSIAVSLPRLLRCGINGIAALTT